MTETKFSVETKYYLKEHSQEIVCFKFNITEDKYKKHRINQFMNFRPQK